MQQGGYPPHGGYPPSQQGGGYPPSQQGGYPPSQQGGYPPSQQGGGYPPSQHGGGYPPQQGGYPPQQQQQQQKGGSGGGYPPSQGGYPPSQGGYPPQQGGYPPSSQQGGYPPSQQGGGYPPQQGGGYPPQQQGGGYGGSYGQQQQGAGGWGAQYYNMIQQQQMNSLEQVFRSADKDRSGSITAKELMTVKWAHNATFTAKTCELLAAIFDTDKNGTVDFREFAQLFQFVQSMHASFMMYDADRSGKLNAREIAQALAHSGFSFQQSTVDNILKKFAKQTYRVGFQMDFEGFIQLCAFIGQLRTLFQMYDRNNSGTISLNMEQLVNVASAF